MADEEVVTKKKTQRRLHKSVYIIVNRKDPSQNELCFDQDELMKKLMDPQFMQDNYPIMIDTNRLYHN